MDAGTDSDGRRCGGGTRSQEFTTHVAEVSRGLPTSCGPPKDYSIGRRSTSKTSLTTTIMSRHLGFHRSAVSSSPGLRVLRWENSHGLMWCKRQCPSNTLHSIVDHGRYLGTTLNPPHSLGYTPRNGTVAFSGIIAMIDSDWRGCGLPGVLPSCDLGLHA